MKCVVTPIFSVFVAFLAVSAAALAAAPEAQADPASSFSEQARERWSRYFPGEPVNPAPVPPIGLMIGAPGKPTIELCREPQEAMARMLDEYGELANTSAKAARTSAETMAETLRSLEASKDPCYEGVARTYIASSVFLLDPSSHHSRLDPYSRWVLLNGKRLPTGLGLTLFAAALLNHAGKDGTPTVVLLTPAVRARLSNGDPNSLWLAHRPPGKKKPWPWDDYIVSAGHDCANTQIYLDPYLPPLNGSAIYGHELTHLFRDQETPADLPRTEHSSSRLPNGDVKAFLLMDEALAITSSAYFQRHLQWLPNTFPAGPLVGFLAPGKTRLKTPDVLGFDLNLFRPNKGPVAKIWKMLNSHSGVPDPSALTFLGETFLEKHAPLPGQQLAAGAVRSEVLEIYQIVHRGYFPGDTLESDTLALLDPSLHGLSLAPLENWLEQNPIQYSIGDWRTLSLRDDWVQSGSVQTTQTTNTTRPRWLGSIGSDTNHLVRTEMNPYLDALDQLFDGWEDRGARPSAMCELYLDALRTPGALGSYAGGKLSSSAHALRPGETGVKGGETGVKGNETIRPCLDLGEKL